MPERQERAAEAPKDLSRLVEQSVTTLQEVDRRLQLVRSDLANLIARAGTMQPGLAGPPGGPGLSPPQAPLGYGPGGGAGMMAAFPPGSPFAGPAGAMMGSPGFGAHLLPPGQGPQRSGGAAASGDETRKRPGREDLPALPRVPAVDLLDEGETFVVHVELPGVKKEDLELTVSDRMVQVHAETRPEVGDGSVVLLGERAPVRYERIVPFPAEVATNKCKANFKDGILTLTVPRKQPGEGPRKVDVAYG